MLRNPANMPLPSDVNFQSAQLDSGILLDNAANPSAEPTTLAVDLLEKINASTEGGVSIASLAEKGSTLVSFNDKDGKTWGLLQVLKMFTHSKVISQPHVVTVNNKPALVRIGSERLLDDETTESSGGSAIIKKKKVEALLQIDITPRISPDDTVTLQIRVAIDDFLSASNSTKITREVSTSANVASGSIFSLGGLTNLINSAGVNKTPGISEWPIIGWLFKRKSDQTIKNNVTVFICPTIIQARLRKGANEYTKDCIALNQKFLDDSGLFTQPKDPITRWFFNDKINAVKDNEIVKSMLNKATDMPSLASQFVIEKPVVVPSIKDTVSVGDFEKKGHHNTSNKQHIKEALTFKTDMEKKQHVLTPTFAEAKPSKRGSRKEVVIQENRKDEFSNDILKLKELLDDSINPFNKNEKAAT
jgi:hypothetical protein